MNAICRISGFKFDWTNTNGRWFGVAKASALGLRPDEWPVALVVEGKTATVLFTDQTLPHLDAIIKANEVGRYYRSGGGHVIHILND